MNATTIEYKKKVWGYLRRLQPGERRKVSAIVANENRHNFIECAKEYMAGLPYNGCISFNHDYTEFYKSAPVPEAEKKES